MRTPRSALIDLQRYPIDTPDAARRDKIVARVRTELRSDGCAVIKNFFTAAGVSTLRNEAQQRVSGAYYSPKTTCNVYLGDGDAGKPDDHPQNIFMERSNGFVPSDNFGEKTMSRRLYAWPPLKDFVADCLDKETLYVYDDPVSNMIVNVNKPGQRFNWHFDTNEFTITMMLQPAESGGFFEYVPNLRSPQDECYNDVKKVLDGDRSRVRRLELCAGDLQLFLGRFSLHRVTPNTGQRERLLLIMSFAEKPGMIGNKVRVADLYGRTLPVHDDAATSAVRADGLLD